MEERHWEDLWHLELDNMEDSPILEMGVKPLKTQCHQQAPETGSNISRKKHLLTSRCWRCRSFFQQPRIQRGKRCLMQGGTEGLSSEGRRQGQGWEIFCISHQPSFPKPVGDGTAVEEEESGEEGGAGAEVPDVQDGADQGQAPQLPVVTGEKRSFLRSHKI